MVIRYKIWRSILFVVTFWAVLNPSIILGEVGKSHGVRIGACEIVFAEYAPLQKTDYDQGEGEDHEKAICYVLYSLVPLGILIVIGIELRFGRFRFPSVGAVLFFGGMAYLVLSDLFILSMLFW